MIPNRPYCGACAYDVKAKSGARACPFNYLYWNFLIENEGRLAGNPRMTMSYRTLRAMGEERRAGIRRDAARFLGSLSAEPGADHHGVQTESAT